MSTSSDPDIRRSRQVFFEASLGGTAYKSYMSETDEYLSTPQISLNNNEFHSYTSSNLLTGPNVPRQLALGKQILSW